MDEVVLNWISYWKGSELPMKGGEALIYTLILLAACTSMVFATWWLTRKILVVIVHSFAVKTKTTWDDHLLNNKFFSVLAYLLPLLFMDSILKIAFYAYPKWEHFFNKVFGLVILYAIMIAINRALKSVKDWLGESELFKDKPLQSYYQVIKILVVFVFIILMFSQLTNKSPLFFLTSLGAMTAILLLVFKDTIMGFVSSIQLSVNDMVRIGDWVTMDKFGADGDVIEINLTTVKIQNFDFTITTIPTYSFISDSFKNWRGMKESDGRRIKKSMKIKIDTVKIADEQLLNKLAKVNILTSYIHEKQEEIRKYNAEHVGEHVDVLMNGRSQTNLGLFRKYIELYLKKNKLINQKMTVQVTQLQSTETGVPIQLYCFSKSKESMVYEELQADIFDHLFAVVKEFDLEIFEIPSGN